MAKTKVTKPGKLKYLGFGFYFDVKESTWKSKPHETSVQKFKSKLKQLCKRKWNVELSYRIMKLNEVIRGWINYFSLASMKIILTNIDSHLRSMIRVIIWKQWKTPRRRQWGLMKLGISKDMARLTTYCGDRYQFVVFKTCVNKAISKEKLTGKGLISCLDHYTKQHTLKLN